MDIRELRYFAAVYRERNLTAAARVCFVSQPSISTAITHLEAELGTTLFIRHKKGVAPTASAEQFHTLARRIICDARPDAHARRAPDDRAAQAADGARRRCAPARRQRRARRRADSLQEHA